MTVKLLTEHHLELLSLKGICTGSSNSTLVKMPHCWKSHICFCFELLSTSERSIGIKLRLWKYLSLSLSDVVFIMLINVKMPTIVGIITFMSRINFMLS